MKACVISVVPSCLLQIQCDWSVVGFGRHGWGTNTPGHQFAPRLDIYGTGGD